MTEEEKEITVGIKPRFYCESHINRYLKLDFHGSDLSVGCRSTMASDFLSEDASSSALAFKRSCLTLSILTILWFLIHTDRRNKKCKLGSMVDRLLPKYLRNKESRQ